MFMCRDAGDEKRKNTLMAAQKKEKTRGGIWKQDNMGGV